MIETKLPRVLTVTEITRSIKGLLETEYGFISVVGEISNLRQPASGHFYFTLKDETSQLKAVMFKQQQRYITSRPTDGTHVICRGRISVYEPRGDYQLIVDFIEPKGVGLLQLAFEKLKNKLAAEGLFDEAQKKEIPFFPKRVALITSPDGAALFDFLRRAFVRFPSIPIEIFPVRVQGDGAAEDVVEALALLNERNNADVIVICRGGGSLEDLWPFNEEKTARAIHASNLPVVTAIGHEVDFTIADFAADYRSSTPTAAAEAVIPDRHILSETIRRLRQRLGREVSVKINECHHTTNILKRTLGDPRTMLAHFLLLLDHSQTSFQHAFMNLLISCGSQVERLTARLHHQNPKQKILFQKQWLDEQTRQIKAIMKFYLEKKRSVLEKRRALHEAVQPLSILGRGYSIVRSIPEGELIVSSRQTEVGKNLEIMLKEGKIECEVNKIFDSSLKMMQSRKTGNRSI